MKGTEDAQVQTRLIRRKHRARLKRKRRFHWGRDLRQDPGMIGQAVTTPCLCSCWGCRPRKHEGETMQERRAREELKLSNSE